MMSDDDGNYFVMLRTPRGSFVPLLDEEGYDLARFATQQDAEAAGGATMFGESFGFEVFDVDRGLSKTNGRRPGDERCLHGLSRCRLCKLNV